jgi:Domain of unknown function (DUF4412)
MKTFRISLLVLVALFFIAPKQFSQSHFEGKIVLEISSGEGTNTVNYYTKGDKVRFEVNSQRGEADIIFDKKNNKMLMIMPAMKMYMEFPMNLVPNENYSTGKGDDSSGEKAKIDFVKTGETKNINGYNCEKWVIKDEKGSSEAWMTKDLGGIMFFESPMSRKSKPKWQQDLEDSGYFPMLVMQKDSDGKETKAFEVKSVEKQSLDDSFFSVPDGFNQMKMPVGGEK